MSENILCVSVVIVTHDRPPTTLINALGSVMNQSLKPKEIIIVDTGGIKTLSEEKKDAVASKGWSVDYHTTAKKQSGPVGRNFGATLCTGKYLAFLDDDDEWYENRLSGQTEAMKEGACLICSNYHIEDEFGKTRPFERPPNTVNALNDIISSNFIGSTSMVLLSRESFNRVGGFDTALESNQEWDLWIRLLETCNYTITDDFIGIKHYSSDCITADRGRRKRGWHHIFHKHALKYIKSPNSLKIASRNYYEEMARSGYYAYSVVGLIIHITSRFFSTVFALSK